MSNSRQPAVRSFSMVCTADYVWRGRKSDWAQLVTAQQGMLTVQTDAGWWVAPPGQAVWLPSDVPNSIEMGGRVVLWALYLRAPLARGLAQEGQVVQLTPLLREILRRIIAHKTLDRSIPLEARLLGVLRDELAAMRPAPLDLARPHDPRAARAAALLRHPSPPATAALLREAGASSRTLERLFKAETGLSLGAWRQRARLLRALQLLADGSSVTRAGLEVGYESTSAFVAAFRRVFGRTPGKYFASAETPPQSH
jgi:AraC-like DNA-binding protein